MTATEPKVGDKVRIIVRDDSALWTTKWWPKKGIETTGTVEKIFKNGNIAVAVHQLRNQSKDRCHTLHFSPKKSGTVLEVVS